MGSNIHFIEPAEGVLVSVSNSPAHLAKHLICLLGSSGTLSRRLQSLADNNTNILLLFRDLQLASSPILLILRISSTNMDNMAFVSVEEHLPLFTPLTQVV